MKLLTIKRAYDYRFYCSIKDAPSADPLEEGQPFWQFMQSPNAASVLSQDARVEERVDQLKAFMEPSFRKKRGDRETEEFMRIGLGDFR